MGIASLANVPYDQPSWSWWSFAHMAHHRDINEAILGGFKVALPEFILDPIDIQNPNNWALQHQQMHNNQNQILGIAGNDLIDVDWSDQNQIAEWIFLNFNEHFQASNALNIG